MQKANLWPALWEGFRLIGREPLSVLVWGVVYMGLALGVQFLSFLAMGSAFTEMITWYEEFGRSVGEGGGPASTPPPTPSGAFYALTQLLQLVVSIFAPALIYTAIFRAVLRPDERRGFYLRFGGDELRMALVLIVFFVLFMILFIVLMILVGVPLIIGVVAVENTGAGVGGLVLGMVLAFALLAAAALVMYTRLGMALPMTTAEGRIRIFESWSFTKGYTWQLIGLAVLQIIISMAAMAGILFAVLGVGAAGAVGASSLDMSMQDPAAMFAALTGAFLPAVLVGGVLYLVVSVVGMPIMLAPWARVHQLIADARDGQDRAVFD